MDLACSLEIRVCVCVCMLIYTCTGMWRTEVNFRGQFLEVVTSFSDTRPIAGTWGLLINLGCLAHKSTSPMLRFMCTPSCLAFWWELWGLNSSPHACDKSTFPIESSVCPRALAPVGHIAGTVPTTPLLSLAQFTASTEAPQPPQGKTHPQQKTSKTLCSCSHCLLDSTHDHCEEKLYSHVHKNECIKKSSIKTSNYNWSYPT